MYIWDEICWKRTYGDFIQFYNARQKIDPNATPVIANKLLEIDSKNHFEKLEKIKLHDRKYESRKNEKVTQENKCKCMTKILQYKNFKDVAGNGKNGKL